MQEKTKSLEIENLELVNYIGQIIKEKFLERKQLVHKHFRYTARNSNKDIWDRAASKCIELNMDPDSFLEMVWSSHTFKQCGMMPQFLYSKNVAQWYAEWRSSSMDEIFLELEGKAENVLDKCHRADIVTDDISQSLQLAEIHTGKNGICKENITFLKKLCVPAPEYVKVILGFPDKEVRSMYGDAAMLKLFTVDIPFRNACEKLNIPHKEILKWLKKKT